MVNSQLNKMGWRCDLEQPLSFRAWLQVAQAGAAIPGRALQDPAGHQGADPLFIKWVDFRAIKGSDLICPIDIDLHTKIARQMFSGLSQPLGRCVLPVQPQDHRRQDFHA